MDTTTRSCDHTVMRDCGESAACFRDTGPLTGCWMSASALGPSPSISARRLPEGWVVGIDSALTAVTATKALAANRGALNLRLLVGDVYQLGLADAAFDVVHAHQLVQHLADPVAALREMRRVCKPGGLVAVRDADYRP